MFFLIGASALLGLIIAMVIILVAAMIVLGVMMAWYLTKPNNNQSKAAPEDVAPIKQPKQAKEPRPAKEPKQAKEVKEIKESEREVKPEPAPYGSAPAYGSAAAAPYGSAASTAPYGSAPAAEYGSGAYGSGTGGYGAGSGAYGSGGGEYRSAAVHGATAEAEAEDAYGTKKPAKLANVEIVLPKSDWGSKSLFERVSSLTNAQKLIYERVRYLLKSRLTNYTTDICEVYFNGELPAARLIVYKGQILVFISLEKDEVGKDRFHVKNVSSLSISNGLPTLLMIKSMDQANGIERLLDKIITS